MRRALLVAAVAAVAALLPPSAVVNDVSQSIAHQMFICAREMYPGVGFVNEILDFWNPQYDFTANEAVGCLQACGLLRLGLRNHDGSPNVTNIDKFLYKHGADEQTTTVIRDVLLKCHNSSAATSRVCTASVQAMKCFRSSIYALQWVPEYQYGPYDAVWMAKQKIK